MSLDREGWEGLPSREMSWELGGRENSDVCKATDLWKGRPVLEILWNSLWLAHLSEEGMEGNTGGKYRSRMRVCCYCRLRGMSFISLAMSNKWRFSSQWITHFKLALEMPWGSCKEWAAEEEKAVDHLGRSCSSPGRRCRGSVGHCRPYLLQVSKVSLMPFVEGEEGRVAAWGKSSMSA